jgi:iron(III) transport system permease protein
MSIVLLILCLMAVVQMLARRLPKGVVPWQS